MLTLDSAVTILRQSGIRVTPQRLMVIDALVDNRTHPTVEHIYEFVRRSYPTISLATVYQTLAMLARHGLITELHGGRDGLRCDPDTSSHAHAYCRICGAIMDIPLPAMDCTTELSGFKAEHLELSIYGRCDSCDTTLIS